jgi:hypothetical protein
MILDTPLADRIIARWMTQLGKPFDSGALHAFLDDKPFLRRGNRMVHGGGGIFSIARPGFQTSMPKCETFIYVETTDILSKSQAAVLWKSNSNLVLVDVAVN